MMVLSVLKVQNRLSLNLLPLVVIFSTILFFRTIHSEEKVEKVIFQGNQSFSTRSLKNLIATKAFKPFAETNLHSDLQTLKNFYHNQGFLSAQIDHKVEAGKIGKIVSFIINEGARVRINLISLSGFSVFPEKKITKQLNLKIGDYLIMQNLEEANNRLIELYKNSGYPYVELEKDVKIQDSTAFVYFSIQEGPLSYIKELIVRGNNTVKTWTIKRATEIRVGEKFSQERLYQAQSRLYATRLFSKVAFYVIGLETKKESLTLRFDVTELKARGFSFGVGYQLPPSRFLFGLGWENLNAFNRGQNLSITSEFTPNFKGEFEFRLEALYKVPYLIRVPLNFTTRPFLNLTNQFGNRTIEFGLETGLNRCFGTNWGVNLTNRYRRLRFNYSDTSLLDTLIKRGITNSLIFNITYDSRNNFFNPTQGLYFSPGCEVAGGLLLGDNDFFRYSFEVRAFQKILGELILAGRGFLGAVSPYGRTLFIPYYEKFFLGGRNTLRGYDEKALGPDSIGKEHYGDFIVNTNLEVRTCYYKNFGLVFFSDGGEIVNQLARFALKRYHFSVGIGLRFNTPVGPIRLDYGKRLRNPEPNDRGKLYIGLLHAF